VRARAERGAAAALVFVAATASASAVPLRVQLQRPATENVETTSRLVAELESEGYELAWVEEHAPSPCASHERGASPAETPLAFVVVERAAEPEELVAFICYIDRAGAFEQASVRAPTSEPQRLALAVVEALNGLQAEPHARQERQEPIAPPTPPPPRPRPSNVFFDAALAVDAVDGLPVVGVDGGLETSVTEHLSLELETFVPLRESDTRGVDRELSLGAAWVRGGARLSWEHSPLRFGVLVQAGPALVWASARTQSAERVGTTASSPAAIVSSGLSLECPSASAFYFRAGGRVSRLLPSIQLALGDGSHRGFGQLLVDVNLGFGVRWGR